MVKCPPEAARAATILTILKPPWTPVVAGAGILAGAYRPTKSNEMGNKLADKCRGMSK
jgi:hypothetical protein